MVKGKAGRFPNTSVEEIEKTRKEKLKEAKKYAAKGEGAEVKDYGPGSFGCHEALHLAWVLLKNVDVELVEHYAVIGNPICFKHAYRAHEELFRLYQELGAIHLTKKNALEGRGKSKKKDVKSSKK